VIWPFRRPEFTVLMVCTANVCRSPAGEALLKHHLRELGSQKQVAVHSLGTDVGSPGRKPDPRVMTILREMGVNTRGLRAGSLSENALKHTDLVYVMENEHREKIIERFPNAVCEIRLLDPESENVPDPYYGSKADVRAMVEQVHELTRERAKLLVSQLTTVSHERAKN